MEATSTPREAVGTRMTKKQEERLPPVYSNWNHPHKNWLDVILVYIFSFFVDLQGLVKYKPSDEEAKKQNNVARESVESNAKFLPYLITGYHAQTGNDLAESTWKIPRRAGMLKSWGFQGLEKHEEGLSEGHVNVVLFYPKSLVASGQTVLVDGMAQKNKFGFVQVAKDSPFDLNKVPSHVPLILFLHGGGQTIGTPYEVEAIALFTRILQEQHDWLKKNQGDQPAEAILASVDYSLSPEHPFPAAPTDVLTVIEYLLHQHQQPNPRPIHIFGISAGGNLATLCALQALRRYGGKSRTGIESCIICAPMLNPCADSVSYYQNSTSSIAVPVAWLRWCWQAYLQLPPPPSVEVTNENDKKDKNDEMFPNLDTLLQRGSNRISYKKSSWNGHALEYLINPTLDVSVSLSKVTKENQVPPQFVVMTNRADPLHDEGVELKNALEKALLAVEDKDAKDNDKTNNRQVRWLDFTGSHWVGTRVDPKQFNELAQILGEMVFGKHDEKK